MANPFDLAEAELTARAPFGQKVEPIFGQIAARRQAIADANPWDTAQAELSSRPTAPEPTTGKLGGALASLQRGIMTAQALPDVVSAVGTAGITKPTVGQERRAFVGAMTDPRYQDEAIAAKTPERAARVEATLGPRAKLGQLMGPAETLQAANVDAVVQAQQEIEATPKSPAQIRMAQARTPVEKWNVWLQDPIELTASIAFESLPPSIAGAAVGSVVGGPAGMVAGVGGSSALMTFSSEFLNNASQMGADLSDPVSFQKFLNDEKAFNAAFAPAAVKSGIVGGVDALTAGTAGRWIEPALKAGFRQKLLGTAQELGLQMAGGAGGEFAGQVATGQDIDPFDIAMEAMAEVATAPGEVAGNLWNKKQSPQSRPAVSPEQPPQPRTLAGAATPAPAGASPQADQVRAELEALPGADQDLKQTPNPKAQTPTLTPEEAARPATKGDLQAMVADLQAKLVANQGAALMQPASQAVTGRHKPSQGVTSSAPADAPASSHEEKLAHKRKVDDEHGKLVIQERDDIEFFGKDSPEARDSTAKLRKFELDNAAWVGGARSALAAKGDTSNLPNVPKPTTPSAPADATGKPAQTFTGSNVQTGTEMPVQGDLGAATLKPEGTVIKARDGSNARYTKRNGQWYRRTNAASSETLIDDADVIAALEKTSDLPPSVTGQNQTGTLPANAAAQPVTTSVQPGGGTLPAAKPTETPKPKDQTPTPEPSKWTPQVGKQAVVSLNSRSKGKLATVIQVQPDGDATVQIHGEKGTRFVRANQLRPTNREANAILRKAELAGVADPKQVEADAREFDQIVEDFGPQAGWIEPEAFDDAVLKGDGITNDRLRKQARAKAARVAGIENFQENMPTDKARALPALEAWVRQRFPDDKSIDNRRAVRKFKQDESQPAQAPAAPEQRTADQLAVDRIASKNPGQSLLQGLRVAQRPGGTAVSKPAAVQKSGGHAAVVSTGREKVLRQLERLFGVRVIPVESANGDPAPFNGYKADDSNIILIDAHSTMPALTLVGHELLHHIQQTHKGLYSELVEVLRPYLQNLPEYRGRMRKKGYSNLDEDSVIAELLGDFTGDSLSDPAFLNDLARREPDLFKRFARIAIQWLDRLIAKAKALTGYGSSEFITDLDSARAILADTLRQAATETQVAKYGGADGIQLRNARLTPPGAFSLKAHHGTPHKVDKFTTAKIGTGEGAQVYGWGLYFAENEQVAEEYRKNLAGPGTVDGQPYNINRLEHFAAASVFMNGTREAAVKELRNRATATRSWNPTNAAHLENVADWIENTKRIPNYAEPRGGNKYTVELNVEPEDLLDWDKPLSEQSEKVRALISDDPESPLVRAAMRLIYPEKSGGFVVEYHGAAIGSFSTYEEAKHKAVAFLTKGGMTGQMLYSYTKGEPADVSKSLLAIGIRGIRYLDQGSRGRIQWIARHPQGGETVFNTQAEAEAFIQRNPEMQLIAPDATYNYVIFSDDDITITHENGQPVAPRALFSRKGQDLGGDLFGAPESVAEQRAREAREKAEGARLKAKEEMANRASARLTGQDLDTTQDAFANDATTRLDKSGQGSFFSRKQPQFESAKREHGITDRIEEAGYILPDGTLLDFSGRANATGYERKSETRFGPVAGQPDYLAGNRQVDHREIEYDGRPSRAEANDAAMEQFLALGAIRTGQGLLDIRNPPTPEQWRRIREVIQHFDGAISLDLYEGKRTAGQWWADGTKAPKIEGQIRRFFDGQELKYGEMFSRKEPETSPAEQAQATIFQNFRSPETRLKLLRLAKERDAAFTAAQTDGNWQKVQELNGQMDDVLNAPDPSGPTVNVDVPRTKEETAALISDTVDTLNAVQDVIGGIRAKQQKLPEYLAKLRNDLQSRLKLLKGWTEDATESEGSRLKAEGSTEPNAEQRGRFMELESSTNPEAKTWGEFWQSLKQGLRYLTSPIPELPLTGDRARASSLFRRGYRLFAVENNRVRKEAAEKVDKVLEPLTKLGRKPADNIALKRYYALGQQRQRAAMDDAKVAKIDEQMLALEQSTLNKDPFNLFRRLVLYRDLWWRGTFLKNEQGKPITLPMGLTVDDVAGQLRRLTDLIANHPDGLAITEALRRHYALTEELQQSILAHGEIIPESLRNPLYFPHHIIDSWTGRIDRVRPSTEEDFRRYLIAPQGSGKLIQTDYLKAMYLHTADVLAHNARVDLVEKYWQAYDISAELKAAHGEAWNKPWNLPPGYKLFTPFKKLPLRMDYILSREVLADKLGVLFNDGDLRVRLGEVGRVLNVKPEDLHAAMVAGEKIQWALPAEIADALTGIAKREAAAANPGLGHAIGLPFRALNNFWKKIKLFAPWNWIRYEYGNLSTDAIDKVLAADPGAARYLKRAAREIWEGDQPGEKSPEYRAALREGVFDTITAGEAGELTKLPEFKQFLTPGEARWDKVRGFLERPMRGSKFREATFRYAKFLADVERLRAGKQPVYAGAFHGDIEALGSDPQGQMKMLEGDDLLFAKAAEISLKTYGDYNSLGVAGQWLRQYAVPFWSWQDVNFRYHANQLRNLADGLTGKAGPDLNTARKAALRYAGVRVVTTLVAIGLAKELWNQFGGVAAGLWDDDDDLEAKLSEADRRRGHILIGKDAKGQAMVVYTPSAWSDVAEWIGGQNMKRLFMEWARGQITLEQWIADYAKQLPHDVGNKAAQAIGPLGKAPYELLSGRSTFPDITDQRMIPDSEKYWRLVGTLTDDRAMNVLRQGFDKDYYAQPAGEQLQQIILQIRRRDPEQWAYYEARESASDWKEAKTGKRYEAGSYNAPEAQALRNFRKSIYRGDVTAAQRFYSRLLEFGYTAERLDASIRSQAPLSDLNEAERKEYQATLDERAKTQLALANQYYARIKAMDGRERQLFPRKGGKANPNPALLDQIVKNQR